jgi:hypothetical protein
VTVACSRSPGAVERERPPEHLSRVPPIIRKGLGTPGKRPHSTCRIAHQPIKRSYKIPCARAIVANPITLLVAAQGAFIATNAGSDQGGIQRNIVPTPFPAQGHLGHGAAHAAWR